jgi:hypothetical protein
METKFKKKFNELSKESKTRILTLIKNLYSCSSTSQYEDGYVYIERNKFTIQCLWGEQSELKSITLCVNDDKNAIRSKYDSEVKELKIYRHNKLLGSLANVKSPPIKKIKQSPNGKYFIIFGFKDDIKPKIELNEEEKEVSDDSEEEEQAIEVSNDLEEVNVGDGSEEVGDGSEEVGDDSEEVGDDSEEVDIVNDVGDDSEKEAEKRREEAEAKRKRKEEAEARKEEREREEAEAKKREEEAETKRKEEEAKTKEERKREEERKKKAEAKRKIEEEGKNSEKTRQLVDVLTKEQEAKRKWKAELERDLEEHTQNTIARIERLKEQVGLVFHWHPTTSHDDEVIRKCVDIIIRMNVFFSIACNELHIEGKRATADFVIPFSDWQARFAKKNFEDNKITVCPSIKLAWLFPAFTTIIIDDYVQNQVAFRCYCETDGTYELGGILKRAESFPSDIKHLLNFSKICSGVAFTRLLILNQQFDVSISSNEFETTVHIVKGAYGIDTKLTMDRTGPVMKLDFEDNHKMQYRLFFMK